VPYFTSKISIFLALTFGIDFALAYAYFASGRTIDDQCFALMGILYMSVPAVTSVVVQKLIFKERIVEPLGLNFKPNLWFVVAWVLPFVLAIPTIILDLLIPGVHYDLQTATLARLALKSMTLFTAINSVVAFGEELGFRGLLWNELRSFGFWRASAVIGLIWGCWHAPLVLYGHNYPQHPQLGFLLFIVNSVFLSFIFSYIRLKSKSVIAVSILHGALNASPAFYSIGVSGGSDLLTEGCGLTVTLTYALVSIIIALLLRKDSLRQAPSVVPR
jgi:uncharacterized protein